jgi:hypothetical protein
MLMHLQLDLKRISCVFIILARDLSFSLWFMARTFDVYDKTLQSAYMNKAVLTVVPRIEARVNHIKRKGAFESIDF